MKLKVRKRFRILRDSNQVEEIAPGNYAVPKDIDEETARKIIMMRCGHYVRSAKRTGKKPPQNKALDVRETK